MGLPRLVTGTRAQEHDAANQPVEELYDDIYLYIVFAVFNPGERPPSVVLQPTPSSDLPNHRHKFPAGITAARYSLINPSSPSIKSLLMCVRAPLIFM